MFAFALAGERKQPEKDEAAASAPSSTCTWSCLCRSCVLLRLMTKNMNGRKTHIARTRNQTPATPPSSRRRRRNIVSAGITSTAGDRGLSEPVGVDGALQADGGT